MPDLQKPRSLIQLVATTDAEMMSKIKTWLSVKGYGIHELEEWISPQLFCKKIGISSSTLARKLKASNCPEVEIKRGPSGRLLMLRPTTSFEKFCNAKQAATDLPRQKGDENP